ncbi:integral membrane protein DUF92-domain-containing protein [Schizophyllum fasciatum]
MALTIELGPLPLELGPLLVASGLAFHGLRKKSLSPSGAATAFAVGYLMLSGALYVFGVTLIVFYLVGSRATKFGNARKAQLESAYHAAGYGYRTGWQVLSNSAPALVAALAWNAVYAPHSLPGRLVGGALRDPGVTALPALLHAPVYAQRGGPRWCPAAPYPAPGPVLSRPLLFAALGHFACCLGDTLASELGILARGQPRPTPPAVLVLRAVPPGTNGALSLPGTLASVAGGALVGLAAAAALVWENGVCARQAGGLLAELVCAGAACGGGGSLLDSVLGATVQETRYDADRKQILSDEEPDAHTREPTHLLGLPLLTNNAVNVVSSVVTATVAAWLAAA